MRTQLMIVAICLAGCKLNPLVSDVTIDAPPPPPDSPAMTHILPAGSMVPGVSSNAELIDQIRINDGLNYTTVMANGGVIALSTGKTGGATVKYWNFGPATLEANNIPVLALMYVFGTMDGSGVFTPLPTHPPLLDSIPGDTRYSAFRRVIDVPVSAQYAGQLFPSMDALNEAITAGLVGDPVPDGTWVNLPVVLPTFLLAVSSSGAPPLAPQQVFAEGYQVDVFELGTSLGRQPLKSGLTPVPLGQASSLLSGVATGSPPVLPTTPDSQPVFQYTIPTAPPTMTPNYTPVTNTLTVQLATGVAPSAIMADTDLFVRNSSGAITGYYTDNVASFTVTTTTNNWQLQFTDGEP